MDEEKVERREKGGALGKVEEWGCECNATASSEELISIIEPAWPPKGLCGTDAGTLRV